MTQPPLDELERAEDLLHSGYKADALSLLVGYLENHPGSAKGWWLMSYAVADFDQEYECLERVLELRPNHRKARERLKALERDVLPARNPLAKLRQIQLSRPVIVLIAVMGCVVLLMIGFWVFRLLFPAQTPLPTQADITQLLEPSATEMAAPATATTGSNATAQNIIVTQASPPEVTYTPLVSITPTPDPNATHTPIPDNQVGTTAGLFPPDFTLINAVTNEEVTLHDYVGQPIVIVFLNTLAKECEPQMPGLQAVYEKYQDQGLVVLGVGMGSSQSALRNYSGRFGGLSFPLLSDWEHNVARSYDVNGVPTTFFVRKNGRIWQVTYGAMTEATMDAVIGSITRMP